MPNLISLVVYDTDKVSAVIRRWVQAGITGLTAIDSSGLGHYVHGEGVDDDVPLFPSLRRMLAPEEAHSRTLLSVVPDGFDVDGLIEVTEQELGPLDSAASGILFVVPVSRAVGLIDRREP
jgi:hypothetical protein